VCKPLQGYFDPDELNLIEDAYEGKINRKVPPAAQKFYDKYPGYSQPERAYRLIKICENIIENGNFVP
jgi:hypothetical protein